MNSKRKKRHVFGIGKPQGPSALTGVRVPSAWRFLLCWPSGRQKGDPMIAPNTLAHDPAKDAEIILNRLVELDPSSRQRMSPAYGRIKDRLLESGWTNQRLGHAVALLTSRKSKRLWLNKSKRSASLANHDRHGHCAYCRAVTSKLTRDHVIPRCQGGAGLGPHNIVLVCRNCNASKGGRTPQQWANDILRYRHPVRSVSLWHRIRLAVNVLIGGH